MWDSLVVRKFEKLQLKATSVGLFLHVNDVTAYHDGTKHPDRTISYQFIIGHQKYGSKSKAHDTIKDHHSACTSNLCPVAAFNTLEEVKAFIIGFCIASKKANPF